jgi:hypothetical protein
VHAGCTLHRGIGCRPPATDVSIQANGFVVHQIVQALRGGGLVVASFGRIQADRVVLVGHSLGSMVTLQESDRCQPFRKLLVLKDLRHDRREEVPRREVPGTYCAAEIAATRREV